MHLDIRQPRLRWFLIVAGFASLNPCVGFAQDRSFYSSSRLTLGTESNLSASVRAGDLDADGDLDLVVANGRHWPQQNYVFLNDGRGLFSIMRPLDSDRGTTYACELADMDSDGDLDIVTGNARAPCHVLLNDGHANFTRHFSLQEISSVRSLTLSDLDLDSHVDVLVTCRGRPNLLYRNQGDGTLSAPQPFGSLSDSTIDLAVGDINGDTRPDLLLANRDGQSNLLLIQDDDLEFVRNSFGDKGDSRAVAVADFDGDGNLDCAVGNLGAENCIYFGDGTGTLERKVTFGGATQSYALAAADMDNDGDTDLIVGNVAHRNVVYFNQGDGRTFQSTEFGAPDTATYGLCVGDFNGDRFNDIAVANSGAANYVFLNRPARSFPRIQLQTQVTPIQAEPRSGNKVEDGAEESAAALTKQTEDWPMFRGPGGRGVSDQRSLPTTWNADASSENGVLWRTRVPGLGHSSPVIVGHKLLVATAVAQSGEAPLQIGRSGAPDAADDQGEQAWQILCYDKRTGKNLWSRTARQGIPRATRHAKATHASSTLTVAGDNVVAFFGSEGLYCYSLDGELRWKRDLGVVNISKYGIGWGYASSPAVFQDRIVLVCDDPENPYLVALNLHDGSEVWRTSRKGDSERSWGTPFIFQANDAAPSQVVVNGWPSVISYDLAKGHELWRINGGGDNPIPTPFVTNGHIYITSAHGAQSPIYVVRPSARGDLTGALSSAPNDSLLWNVSRGGSYMSTPVVYRELLYLGNSNGILRCFDATTGHKLYEQRLGNDAGIIASLIAGDGKIYCASENGNTYVVQAGPEFKLLSTNATGGPCLATPAISEGILYFRNTQELVAIQ